MSETREESIGEIIAKLFDEYLEHYQDKDLAAVAAAATINEWLNSMENPPKAIDDIRAA